MDPQKLRDKAEKLLAKARAEESKRKDLLNKKLSSCVLSHIKLKGYVFNDNFALAIKQIIDTSGMKIDIKTED